MRILFVTPSPPSRMRVRSYGFLTQLRGYHEVTVAAQCASEQELADAEALRRQGYEVLAMAQSRGQAVLRSGTALFGSRPAQVAHARSRRLGQAVQDLCAQRPFDVVHVEHVAGIASMDSVGGLPPLVWDAADCTGLLCKGAIAAWPGLALLEQQHVRRYVAGMPGRQQHIVVASERARQAMFEAYRTETNGERCSDAELGARICVLPDGVDLQYFQPIRQKSRRLNLVFSGNMGDRAHVAAAIYLQRQVMPLVWQHKPQATLTIVGSKPPAALRRLALDARVEVTGCANDLRPYLGRADLMVSPLVNGAGIQNSVLEAMAMGTPVVVAAQAAAALGAQPGRELLTASTALGFAEAAVRLLDDAELRASFGSIWTQYVELQHDLRDVGGRLVRVYQRAVAGHAAVRAPLAYAKSNG